MAHLALYRTYRPQYFDSVIGQKHIVQTMKNQIKNDLLSHAYVLTGPRGTGKTTLARIVAKAINCTNSNGGNPCCSCESCLAVTHGNHPDVLELDGASNNGVEEIREIRERTKYLPSLSPYKVYIIDEVHMLSTAAFNALLKTLEEPPTHVLFMLATTEIHKVPDTILSRVQRFDLKQIPSTDMSAHLGRILNELGVSFEPGVPELVATLAAGGLRDALSMLDQAIAYKADILELSDIHDLNGTVEVTELIQVISCVTASDFAGVVQATRRLFTAGKLPARIIDGLLGLLRDVLKVQKVGGTDDTGLTEKLNSRQVLTLIKKLNNLAYELKIATDAGLILEIGLIELGLDEVTREQSDASSVASASAQRIPDYFIEIQSLVKKVADLEAEVIKLKSQQVFPVIDEVSRPAVSDYVAPQISKSEGEMPIYVQGELIQDDIPSATVIKTVDQSVETNILVPEAPLLIEEILANATKQDKAMLSNKIGVATPFAELDMKETVMLLKDAEIVAASPMGCILVYDYETTAQRLLMDSNREKAHRILADMMERPYGFLSLPKAFWLVQRKNYVLQSKQGSAPTLQQYPQCSPVKAQKVTNSEKEMLFYQEVVDMFGDVVEVRD